MNCFGCDFFLGREHIRGELFAVEQNDGSNVKNDSHLERFSSPILTYVGVHTCVGGGTRIYEDIDPM